MRQTNYRVYLFRKSRHPTTGVEERHITTVAGCVPDLDSAHRELLAYIDRNGGTDAVTAAFDGFAIEWEDVPG